ncbi:MAG: flagellar biosynthetic protein FliP [Candidatus Latescibacteria bacterium 4484_7]|nr:MAG: flagellar biosynthetic protein FliP [Candidatus Latescibacteria bacterium 4484_7]
MKKRLIVFFLVLLVAGSIPVVSCAQQGGGQGGVNLPGVTFSASPQTTPGAKTGRLDVAVEIVIALTVLSLAPAILIMLTSFTRIIVVFSFLRQALGTQQMPPSQLLIGLALFLTLVIMYPVFDEINSTALQPYLHNQIDQKTALEKGFAPLRKFMLLHAREKDIKLFLDMRGIKAPISPDELPATVVIPGFVISELRTAFQIGFLIYLPFLVIDLVVSSVLMSMGMLMLPPVMISLPFKILLFVLVDGWHLLVQSLVSGFAS